MTLRTALMVFAIAATAASCSEPLRNQATEEPETVYSDSTYNDPALVTSPDTASGDSVVLTEYDKFRRSVNRRIDRNRLDIEELKNESSRLKKDARKEYEEAITRLETENEKLRNRLNSYRGSTESEWDEFTKEFNADMDELGRAISNTFKRDKRKKQ